MGEVNTEVGGKNFELPVNAEWEAHPLAVKEMMTNGEDVILLDVRQLREWNFARIEGAILAPMNELEARAQRDLAALKQRRIVVYCHVGGRSLRATHFLRQMGFANVHSMAGGIEAWSLMVDPAVPRY